MQLNKVPTPYLPNYAPEISVTPLIGEKTAPSSDDFSLLEPLVRSDTWARSSQTIPADNMRIAEKLDSQKSFQIEYTNELESFAVRFWSGIVIA